MTEQTQGPKHGCISTGFMLFGSICAVITVVSVINVAFDLDMSLRYYGSRTKLPTDWMAVIALAVVSAITLGIYALMTNQWLWKKYQTYPWLKAVIPLAIILVLGFGFYKVYYNMEYAGPLHYATRANDLEEVKEELQKGVDNYEYFRSVYECIELGHAEVLSVLLEHPTDDANINEDFIYALEAGSKDVILVFINAGVSSEGESGDFLAQFLAVSDLPKEEKETVGLKLLENGADPHGLYTGGYMGTDLTALEQAREQGLTALVAAMDLQEAATIPQ